MSVCKLISTAALSIRTHYSIPPIYPLLRSSALSHFRQSTRDTPRCIAQYIIKISQTGERRSLRPEVISVRTLHHYIMIGRCGQEEERLRRQCIPIEEYFTAQRTLRIKDLSEARDEFI
jgi:hypothetical protein